MEGTPIAKWNNRFEMEGQRTLLRQLAYVTGNPNISGSMFYAQNQMRAGRENNMYETMVHLSETQWRYPALVPPMPHLGGIAPSAPVNVSIEGNNLLWENSELEECHFVMPRYFVIYRSANAEFVDINNPANIVAIVPAVDGQVEYEFTLPRVVRNRGYHFFVTAVNRLHDESEPSVND
jgi:hypothetical protein